METVWELPQVSKILRRQRDDGSWGPTENKGVYPPGHKRLMGAFKTLRTHVRRYSFTRKHGAALLQTRFFKPDTYTSYRGPGCWVRFQFWWLNIVASLDSLSRMGFSRDDPDIKKALGWLVDHQRGGGLWDTSCMKDRKPRDTPLTREREL